MIRVLLTIHIICDVPGIFAYNYTEETNLQSTLTSGYDTAVRPSGQTKVGLSFGLMSIGGLDTVSQEFFVTGFLMSNWIDDRLMWDPSTQNNISSTKMQFSRIWTPSLLINNAADGITVINDNTDLSSIFLRTNSDGTVIWLAPITVTAQCSVNIASYPLDKQSCFISASSWMFSNDEIFFYSSMPDINLDLYTENGEWDITSTSVANATRKLMGFPMSAVTFTVNISRKYAYYVITMILPVTILALLAPFVFLLPVECGEQNGYSLTVMLSLSVVMTLVAESIPPTASNISILSVYLLVTFILCSVQTLQVVFMTKLYSYHAKGRKLSKRVNRIANIIGRITFHRCSQGQCSDGETENNTCLVTDIDFKKSSSPIAWKNEAEKTTEKKKNKTVQEEIYSYEEFAHVLNNLNFVVSFLLTAIITVIFMSLLTS